MAFMQELDRVIICDSGRLQLRAACYFSCFIGQRDFDVWFSN